MPSAGNWGGLNAVTVTDEKPRSPRLEGDHPTLPRRHQVKVTPLTSLLLAWGLADCQCNKTRKECVLRHHCTTQRRSIKIAAFTGALTFVIATGLEVGPLLARSHPSETGARHHSKTGTRHATVRHIAKPTSGQGHAFDLFAIGMGADRLPVQQNAKGIRIETSLHDATSFHQDRRLHRRAHLRHRDRPRSRAIARAIASVGNGSSTSQ